MARIEKVTQVKEAGVIRLVINHPEYQPGDEVWVTIIPMPEGTVPDPETPEDSIRVLGRGEEPLA